MKNFAQNVDFFSLLALRWSTRDIMVTVVVIGGSVMGNNLAIEELPWVVITNRAFEKFRIARLTPKE